MLTCYRNSSLIVYPLFSRVFPIRAVSGDCDVRLAVECLDCMMRKRRQVSIQRVLGFVKRLSTLSSQLLPGACLAVMATIKRFIQVSYDTHFVSNTHIMCITTQRHTVSVNSCLMWRNRQLEVSLDLMYQTRRWAMHLPPLSGSCHCSGWVLGLKEEPSLAYVSWRTMHGAMVFKQCPFATAALVDSDVYLFKQMTLKYCFLIPSSWHWYVAIYIHWHFPPLLCI